MSLAEVLAWKFNDAPGIRTREENGKMEIFDWPESLGPVPTQGQIGQWTGEFNDRPPPSLDEIYDQTMQNQKLLKAFVLCINDGSIIPNTNVSGAALKAAIKAKM